MTAAMMRWALAPAAALLITIALFVLMTRMISGTGAGRPALAHYDVVDFVRLAKDQPPKEKKHEQLPKPKPPPRRPVPPKPVVQRQQTPPAPVPPMPVPAMDTRPQLAGGPAIGRLAPAAVQPANDNEVVPLVQIPPVYPARAARLHLGGTVVVEFTINEIGRVQDPAVVKSNPPRIFDQAAIRAIMRWRFKPKLQDGKAVARRARQRFDFTPPS